MENSSKSESVIYYSSSKKKAIIGAILMFLILGFILTLIFTPEAEFIYLFGTIEFSTILLFASLIMTFYFIMQFDGHRDSKIFLDSNGDLDICTPREYTQIPTTLISRILGRANLFYQKNLYRFSYNDGCVYIENDKGDYIEAPLSELIFSYKMTKHKITGDWYIYQYIIEDSNGSRVKFNYHSTMFNDKEYADIEMLLSLSGEVKETKYSKINRKLTKITETIHDFDFSDLSSSLIEHGIDITTEKITNFVGNQAKKRIIDHLSHKKKSILKRIFNYLIIGIIILYAIIVIVVNIQSLFSETDFSLGQDLEELYLGGEDGVHLFIDLKNGSGCYFSLPSEPGDASIVEYKVLNYDPKSGKLDLLQYEGEIDIYSVIYKGIIDKEGNYCGIITDMSGNKLDNFEYHRDREYYEWKENHSIEENDDEIKTSSVHRLQKKIN